MALKPSTVWSGDDKGSKGAAHLPRGPVAGMKTALQRSLHLLTRCLGAANAIAEERCAAATAMVEAEGLAGAVPVVVDSMANVVRDAYAAWPERLFIIQDGLLVHLQRADAAGGVDLLAEEAEAALAALVPQHSIGTG